MDVKIFIDRNQYAVEIRHNNKRLIRYTNIPDNFNGGEYSVVEINEDMLTYKITPLYERLETVNGYVLNYNIKLTNWLNFFVFKSIRSMINESELEVKKEPSEFSKVLKEITNVKLK